MKTILSWYYRNYGVLTSKSRDELGFKPKINLIEGLTKLKQSMRMTAGEAEK